MVGLRTAFYDAASIHDLGRRTIASLNDVDQAGMADLTKPRWGYGLPLGATAALKQQVRGQRRPARMRWSQPPIAEIPCAHRGDLARAGSQAARRPRKSWHACRKIFPARLW